MVGIRQEDGRELVEGELAVGFRVIDFFELAGEFQRGVVRRGVMNVGQLATQQLVDEVIGAAANGSVLVDRRAEAGSLLEFGRSEEHTSELQSRPHLVCRLLLEKKKIKS